MAGDRRKFIKDCGLLTVAASCSGLLSACQTTAKEKTARRSSFPLLAPFTEKQEALVKSSYLANQDVKGLVKEGYGCGDILLKAYAEKHRLSEDLLDATVAFKDGMGFRDTCCLYTCAVMIFGLSVKVLSQDRWERYNACKKKIERFRNWWLERSPMNCGDIFPACKNGYVNQYKKVAYVVEKILHE